MDPNPGMSTITNPTSKQVLTHETDLVTIYNTDNEVVQNDSEKNSKTSLTSKCCKKLQAILGGLPNEYLTTTAY